MEKPLSFWYKNILAIAATSSNYFLKSQKDKDFLLITKWNVLVNKKEKSFSVSQSQSLLCQFIFFWRIIIPPKENKLKRRNVIDFMSAHHMRAGWGRRGSWEVGWVADKTALICNRQDVRTITATPVEYDVIRQNIPAALCEAHKARLFLQTLRISSVVVPRWIALYFKAFLLFCPPPVVS